MCQCSCGLKGCTKPVPFRWLGRCVVSRPAAGAPDRRGRADGDDIGVEHHEGQPPVAFERMLRRGSRDRLLLPVLEPVVAGDLAVVLVGFAVALLPVVELALGDASQPTNRRTGISVRSDQLATKSTTSSRISWGTQSPFRAPQALFLADVLLHEFGDDLVLATSFSRRRDRAWCSALGAAWFLRSKAAAPFSKNCFCRVESGGCSPCSSHRSEMGTLSIRWRLRMATFSSGRVVLAGLSHRVSPLIRGLC